MEFRQALYSKQKEKMMADYKCPLCGCPTFYVKDPDDAFETYVFNSRDGQISFCEPADTYPEVLEDTETYCNQCAWHDKYKVLEKAR